MGRIINIKQPLQRSIVPEVLITNPNPENFQDIQFDISEYCMGIDTFNGVDIGLGRAKIYFATGIGKAGIFISNDTFINYLKKKILPFSIISVKIDRTSPKPDFVGIVNKRYESITTETNQTSRALVVDASLVLPYLLMKDSLPLAAILQNNELVTKVLGEVRTQFFSFQRGSTEKKYPFSGKPEDAIHWIIKNSPSTNIANQSLKSLVSNLEKVKAVLYKDANGKYITGNPMLNLQMLKNEFLFDLSLSVFQGNVYDYMMKAVDKSFYEVFFTSELGEDSNFYNQTHDTTETF